MHGRFIEIQSKLRRKKFKERVMAPIFLEVLLATDNLEEKVNSSNLKYDFISTKNPSIFT